MLKKYYEVVKPGMVYGNVLTTIAAFLFASRWHFDPALLVETTMGMMLVVASACVFNNYIDRDIDKKMERTKHRALATNSIPAVYALVYGALLGLVGVYLLYTYVNTITTVVALVGFVSYVGMYTPYKRYSHWGAVVGSISGAMPIVAGYTAVVGRLDMTVFILFSILALWQLPHFYAIALYRADEYKAAGIPVLPARKGIQATKKYILCYMVLFIAATVMLTVLGYAGYVYLAVMFVLGALWFYTAMQRLTADNAIAWARKVFLRSLVVLLSFSAVLSVATLLP